MPILPVFLAELSFQGSVKRHFERGAQASPGQKLFIECSKCESRVLEQLLGSGEVAI